MEIKDKNIKTIFWCSLAFLALLIINFLFVEKITCDSVRIFFATLVSTVATVLLANVLWELLAKKNFANSLLDLVKISENISKSGIDTVYVDFRDINWNEEFKNTKSFTAAFTYAYSWRNTYQNAIERYAGSSKRRKSMRIVVPDPEDPNCMKELDRRFNSETGATRKKIEDCIKYFKDIGANVYLYKGTLQSSYYMLDKVSIMSFFPHAKEKGSVPAIRASKSGNMYAYISKDLDSLISQSERVQDITINIDADGNRTVSIRRDRNE